MQNNNNEIFLKSVHIEEYGAIHDRSLCGLTPGLNIVYGPNEAGKTTFSEFIQDQIVGYRKKSKTSNSYQDENNNRGGFLEFGDADNNTYKFVRKDEKNGPVFTDKDKHFDFAPDKDTYEIANKITSSSLAELSKDNSFNKISAAGASTLVSPGEAIKQIDYKLSDFSYSGTKENDNSLIKLHEEIDAASKSISAKNAQLNSLSAESANSNFAKE